MEAEAEIIASDPNSRSLPWEFPKNSIATAVPRLQSSRQKDQEFPLGVLHP